jgi:hypothetical protein
MSSSNIRVFVQWKDATVFAGEDIECTITFKNTATPEGRDRSPTRKQNGFAPGGDRQRKLPPPVHPSTRPSVSRKSSFASQPPPVHVRGHRPALSLNTPSTIGERKSPISPSGAFGNNTSGQRHGRSLSIMSMGADAATETDRDRGTATQSQRPSRGHARSGSLQIVPGRPNPSYPGTLSAHEMASWLIVVQLIHRAIARQHILLHSQVVRRLQPKSKTMQASSPFLCGLGGDD